MAAVAELFKQALLFHQQGDLRRAEPLYREILQADPVHADALHLLGFLEHQVGRSAVGIPLIRRAIALTPLSFVYHSNLGIVLKEQGHAEAAIACYREALRLNPRFVDALSNLGLALRDQDQLEEAIACYRRALQINPDHAHAHNNLGIALRDQGHLDEALACFREALRLHPPFVDALNNLGLTLTDRGELDEAIACCRQALRLDPDHASTHNTLGIALKDQGRLDEAVDCFEQALRLKPDYASARWNRSLSRLAQGDFLSAWPDFECRWQLSGFVRCHEERPRWDGSPLEGKTILLYAEQGLGDTIQFIRYARLVKQRGGTVLCECQPLLLQLLAETPGIDHLVAVGSPLPPFDVRVPLMSLPGVFGTTLAAIPAEVPYLRADVGRVESWRKELEPLGGFKIGIVWQGSPTHGNDRQRSIPLERFAPLSRLAGVRLLSLQVGAGTEQLTAARHLGVIDLSSRFDQSSFADAAAVLHSLDLVVTVDTALAHLAGALGVPVWVLLPTPSEWRWLLERSDSPWYPTMRLFRQSRPGDWDEVLRRVAAALQERLTL